MRRRRFIASVSALAFGIQAGCIAEGDVNPSGSDPPDVTNDTETPAPSPSQPDQNVQPSVQGYSIETNETECKSDSVTGISVSFAETTVKIEGIAETPTPCHEAVIESAVVTTGELHVQVGFDRDDSDVCVECVGTITYEAMIDLDTSDGIDTVTVTHGGKDDLFTEARSGDEPPTTPSDDPDTTPLDDPESDPDPDLQISLDN